MLHQSADFRLQAIVPALAFRERRASAAFFAHFVFDIQVLQNLLNFLARIGAVGVQRFSSIRFIQKFFSNNAIARVGGHHAMVHNQRSVSIRLDVIFAAKKARTVFVILCLVLR